MGLNLRKKVFQILSENRAKKFTAKEIASCIHQTFPKECEAKMQRSKANKFPILTEADLIQQITAEIGAIRPVLEKKYTNIKTTDSRPRKYYFVIDQEDSDSSSDQQLALSERDLIRDVFWYPTALVKPLPEVTQLRLRY